MNIACAQCGASFPLRLDSPFVPCPFCSCTLYLSRAASFRHMGLPVRLGPRAALDLVRAEARRRSQPVPDPVEVWPALLPFWSLRGECLQETLAAFAPLPLALVPFQLPAAQASWFRKEDYPGFSALAPSELSPLSWKGRCDGASASLYGVPFYRVRYGGAAKPYEAWVDAAGSRVFWGIAPPAGNRESSKRFVRLCAGLVGLFAAESFILPGGLLACAAVALTAGLLYASARRALAPEGAP